MIKKTLAIAIFAVSLQSCATLSSSHPKKMAAVKNSFSVENQPLSQEESLEETFNSNNQNTNIGYLEKGRFEQLNNETDLSTKNYSNAITVVRNIAMQPIIKVSSIAQDTAAVLTSDKERDYNISSYQVTFLYAYQALNYLKQNKLESAAVSIRNLSDAQDIKRKQEELARQEEKDNKGSLSEVFNMQSLSSYLASSGELKSIDNLAKGASNSYANPMSYYLEAIIYEAYDTDYNNAFLSIKNAKDAAPNNKYIEKTFNDFYNANKGGSAYKPSNGRLTVIYEQDFVTPLSKCEISIPMSASFMTSAVLNASIPAIKISLPCYKLQKDAKPISTIDIQINSNGRLIKSDKTNILVDTTAMAAKSLQEDYPSIMARELLRATTKTTTTIVAANIARHSSDDYGAIASIGVTMTGSAYQMFTTIADNRSWLLLPNDAQLYTDDLDEGKYQINIAGIKENISIKNGKNTLVWVTSTGKYHTTQYNNFL